MTRAHSVFLTIVICLWLTFTWKWFTEVGRRVESEKKLWDAIIMLDTRHYEITGVYTKWMKDRNRLPPKGFWKKVMEDESGN